MGAEQPVSVVDIFNFVHHQLPESRALAIELLAKNDNELAAQITFMRWLTPPIEQEWYDEIAKKNSGEP